jgi:hypothetical protein
MNTLLSSYCHVYLCLKAGFRLVIGFINNLEVVTAINYSTIADLHKLQSLHTNLLSLFPGNRFITQELWKYH